MTIPQTFKLAPENTVSVEGLSHRLALGVTALDAVSLGAASSRVAAALERIGPYALSFGFDGHGPARHALLHAGRVASTLAHALKKGKPTTFAVRLFGGVTDPGPRTSYRLSDDPRHFVPRRIAVELVLDSKLPATGLANVRSYWLYPGSAYPFPSGATLLRGRLLRASNPLPKPIPWGRVLVTMPGTEIDLTKATPVGVAFGDDRGEFACALGGRIVNAATLPKTVNVRLWPQLPPANVTLDPLDPLGSLPLEAGARDRPNDPLGSVAQPTNYLPAPSLVRTITLGEANGGSANDLLFP